jgi:methionyl-tRNA formyltransferase
VTDGPVRTVFLGSGGFGRESLWRLSEHPDVELVGVVTAPPKPAGRGGRLATTPIHDAARHLEIRPILTPERLRDQESISEVLALEPGLAILADYGQIVPQPLLELAHGALNLHPSLLPRYRGATPIPATILAGDAETGVSLMRMDEGLDTGPLLGQVRVPLDGDETTPLLEEMLEVAAAGLLTANLGPWLRGKLATTPQAEHGITLTRSLRRADGRLDPGRGAQALERQVRAYQPWPGSFIETPDGRLTVWASEVGGTTDAVPGSLGKVGLAAADGRWLRLLEVQPAGGRRMPWAAFLRGRPAILGASIVG